MRVNFLLTRYSIECTAPYPPDVAHHASLAFSILQKKPNRTPGGQANDRNTVHCISLQLHVDLFEHDTSLWTLNLYKCLTNKLISHVQNIYSDFRGQVRFPRHKYFLYGNISGSRRCFSSSFHLHISGRTVNHDPFKNSLNEAASAQHCFNISRLFLEYLHPSIWPCQQKRHNRPISSWPGVASLQFIFYFLVIWDSLRFFNDLMKWDYFSPIYIYKAVPKLDFCFRSSHPFNTACQDYTHII